MHNLKNVTRRASALAGAVTFAASLGVMLLPPGFASADALNPLTDRSLTLSSSSPGWSYTDGSGNGTYAQPNSGANGQKTGETFQFNVSTDSTVATGTGVPITGLSFQFCTAAAGPCTAPGDDGWTGTSGSETDTPDSASTSNLNVVTDSPSEVSSGNYSTYVDTTSAHPDYGDVTNIPNRNNTAGNFIVETNNHDGSGWVYSPDWTMTSSAENDASGTVADGTATGDMDGTSGAQEGDANYIQLANSSTGYSLKTGGTVKVVFFGTDTNYITNPGNDAFFVKINDYNTNNLTDMIPYVDNDPDTQGLNVVDGGVTVANVMNQSIAIQTKVLETMDFSVGTVDPDTLTDAALKTAEGKSGSVVHGQCDPILTSLTPGANENILSLGNQTAENSLSTSETYGTYSFFRLSSNSSAGANIYYAGETLSNTEGNQIQAMGTTPEDPTTGSPQFGLALDNDTNPNDTGTYDSAGTTESVNYAMENGFSGTAHPQYDFEQGADGEPTALDTSWGTDKTAYTDVHDPQLAPLVPASAYADGTGNIDNVTNTGAAASVDTEFAFDANANQVPALIADENAQVVDCITGKVRYIANIAATTPAGIYTTKINYVASPQY
jgi:hypothetical protein